MVVPNGQKTGSNPKPCAGVAVNDNWLDLELAVSVVLAVFVGWLADTEGKSPLAWGAVTLILCLISSEIPFPFGRMLLVLVAVVLLMWVHSFVLLICAFGIKPPRLD